MKRANESEPSIRVYIERPRRSPVFGKLPQGPMQLPEWYARQLIHQGVARILPEPKALEEKPEMVMESKPNKGGKK